MSVEEFEEVVALAKSNPAELMPSDQLINEMQARRVFAEFVEAPIDFAPTYRMLKGESGYSNKRNQPHLFVIVPSFIHACLDASSRCIMAQAWSDGNDHRPVFARYFVGCNVPLLSTLMNAEEEVFLSISVVEMEYLLIEGGGGGNQEKRR